MVDALNSALHIAMSKDKKVMILGEDVAQEGGVFICYHTIFLHSCLIANSPAL